MKKRIEKEYDDRFFNEYEPQNHSADQEKEDDAEYDCVVNGHKTVYRWDEYGQNIVVDEINDPETGKIVKQVYRDGDWKRPSGIELLCVPVSDHPDKDGAIYSCFVRTHPDNRTYGY